MELQITGTNMEIAPQTNRYIETKFSKLSKHLPDIIDIKIEVTEEGTKSRQQRYLVRAAVNSSVGRTIFHGEERAEDFFKAVDKTAKSLTRQLEKHKGKLYDRGRGNQLVRGKFSGHGLAESPGKIVKTKSYAIEPMSPEDAIEEMEALSHDFFLFLDNKSGEVQLLYRRKDGNYGIIQPIIKK